MVVAGELWKQFGGGTWYTVTEVAPGVYAYRYSDDPRAEEPEAPEREAEDA